MHLNQGDIIITAYAESCAGPGWANTPIWVIVRDLEGKMRLDCLQPDEQTHDMRLLYRLSEAAHQAMLNAIEKVCVEPKRINYRG